MKNNLANFYERKHAQAQEDAQRAAYARHQVDKCYLGRLAYFRVLFYGKENVQAQVQASKLFPTHLARIQLEQIVKLPIRK